MGSNSENIRLHRKQGLSRECDIQSREAKSLHFSARRPASSHFSDWSPHDAASLSLARRSWHDLTLPKSNAPSQYDHQTLCGNTDQNGMGGRSAYSYARHPFLLPMRVGNKASNTAPVTPFVNKSATISEVCCHSTINSLSLTKSLMKHSRTLICLEFR